MCIVQSPRDNIHLIRVLYYTRTYTTDVKFTVNSVSVQLHDLVTNRFNLRLI